MQLWYENGHSNKVRWLTIITQGSAHATLRKHSNDFSFLGKNISNFVPPAWKLHNPYCHIAYPSSEKVSSLWDSSGVFSVVFFDTVTPLIVTEVGSPISKVAGTAGGGALGLWRGVGPTLWVDRPAEAATDDGLLTLGGGCGGLKIMFLLSKKQSHARYL